MGSFTKKRDSCEDGSAASLAVAINSFDYFFYRGLGIRAGGDIPDIFGLTCEDF